MDKKDLIKQAILDEASRNQAAKPLMNAANIKDELLAWLAPLKLPSGSDAKTWEELIQEFPSKPEEKQEQEGLRVRLALPLSTRTNKYLVSILECLDPDSRGVYLISAHVNWKSTERRAQKLIDESYYGHFDDLLRAKHTLWAQTFKVKELAEAMNRCAAAILANELVHQSDQVLEGEPMPRRQPPKASFPKPLEG